MNVKGRCLVRGRAEGELLPSMQPFSFLGGIDPRTGTVRDTAHELCGVGLKGKILALPNTVGSSVGAYVLYGIARKGLGPAGIVTGVGDINLVSGCAAAGIPLLAGVDIGPLVGYKGSRAMLDCDGGTLSV
ncbi:MAG: DUF126 domain-containing protein [Nitrososphaerota archaeon]|nr:DUF126 domain-containing protein [Nitrososphaerota archaeon]MDG6939102.1 DUF126 domain-containing protein [Nitrososphaerota archaeon]